jgi:SAM-dependent methyltransferase
MDDVSKMVARQYEAYAYPEPFPDLAAQVAGGYFELGDPSRYGPLIWPEGRPRERLRILSAGCGTVQAAYLAFTNRDCEVVGVDLSAASLGHERYLQDRHGLTNLSLYQGDLRDVGRIGRTFDYIVCSGVLHHLADPDAGLRALAGVLAPDGAVLLMVYGATARAGVYMVQDALRRLHVPQTAEGVAFGRHLLEQLPDHHYVRWYLSGATELKHDTAFVDTFLHPQDRAYTVPQLLDFLARNGLALHGWVDNAYYFPDAALARFQPEVRDAVAALPEPEQWAVVEMLTLRMGMHVCVARPAPASSPARAADFGAADWDLQVAHWAPGLQRLRAPGPFLPAQYRRGPNTIDLGANEAALLDAADGTRTLRELLAMPFLAQIQPAERELRGRRFFGQLWRMGHLMFSRPGPAARTRGGQGRPLRPGQV